MKNIEVTPKGVLLGSVLVGSAALYAKRRTDTFKKEQSTRLLEEILRTPVDAAEIAVNVRRKFLSREIIANPVDVDPDYRIQFPSPETGDTIIVERFHPFDSSEEEARTTKTTLNLAHILGRNPDFSSYATQTSTSPYNRAAPVSATGLLDVVIVVFDAAQLARES